VNTFNFTLNRDFSRKLFNKSNRYTAWVDDRTKLQRDAAITDSETLTAGWKTVEEARRLLRSDHRPIMEDCLIVAMGLRGGAGGRLGG
jgi:hypothetical protein